MKRLSRLHRFWLWWVEYLPATPWRLWCWRNGHIDDSYHRCVICGKSLRVIKRRGGTIAVSWGNWGGFYFNRGYTTRLCLGRVAITYIPEDLDPFLESLAGWPPPTEITES